MSGRHHATHTAADALAGRVARARLRMAHQNDPALTDALSDDELAAERELAEYTRRLDRAGLRASARSAAAARERARKTADAIAAIEQRDTLGAARALAEHRRTLHPAAWLAGLRRYRVWAGRGVGFVVTAAMGWSAVNVQHNIAAGLTVTDPLYWFSYLVEAMISVCLIIVMAGASRLAACKIHLDRRARTAAEAALLALTLGLNTYPHLRTGAWFEVGVHSIPPAMIGIALLIHHTVSTAVAHAMHQAAPATAEPESPQATAGAPTPAPMGAPPRAPAAASAPAPAPAAGSAPTPTATPAAPAARASAVQLHPSAVHALAARLIAEGATTMPPDVVAVVIAAADADAAAGRTPRITRIAKHAKVHHKTVKRIVDAATVARGNARVIALRPTIQQQRSIP
ncbi:hypothetical protein IU459_27165 [Nocardia amamiensis]|uniref:DUF2637 domain-containing protein n=1 Tax=Nocardia amamiensis TaxID=404578 RepID=A0ABS0CX68_9NOCA|nr:hypothetical protein [Nocardia amamiensis]MBF6301197.1 hypothetical protein [Nocardia amamiensis]